MSGHTSSVLIGGNFNPVLDLADPCLEMLNKERQTCCEGQVKCGRKMCHQHRWVLVYLSDFSFNCLSNNLELLFHGCTMHCCVLILPALCTEGQDTPCDCH